MKYSDKEISGECQACEPETVYAAAADRQQDFSHQLALEHSVISDEVIAEGYMSLEEFDQHLTDFIRSKFESRR